MTSRRNLFASLLSALPLLPRFRALQRIATGSSSAETVERALSRFVSAFEDLDWERFRRCFTTNATVFHPAPPNIKRIDSRERFEQAWLGVFDRIKRNSGRQAPPYMKLEPADVRVERLADDVALVTFHLFDGGVIGRRTLVFQRQQSLWNIAHVHASNSTAWLAVAGERQPSKLSS